MPPIPNSTTEYANNPVIVGYIARQLLKGTYPALSELDLKRQPEAEILVRALIAQVLEQHGPALSARFAQLRNPQSSDHLARTLNGLNRFTLPLSVDPGIKVVQEIENTLPELIPEIATLLHSPPFEPFSQEDAQALALAQWFKHSYMRWVDPIPCPNCGGKTTGIGGDSPNAKELEDGAGRVELHRCEKGDCGSLRRFARYVKISTLLRTREGRCGEWAHLFYIFLLVTGLQARYVWNSEDHVWTEYWSPALRHWVHVDSCEAATNKPLIYAKGWGKKQAFCIAIGPYGAEDVTRGYVDDFEGACQGRRRALGWSERSVRQALMELTVRLRLSVSREEQKRLERMDKEQNMWMLDEKRRLAEAERDELGGRISGTADWRAQRQELGLPELKRLKYKVLNTLTKPFSDFALMGQARHQGSSVLLTDGNSQTSGLFLPTPLSQTQDFRCRVTFRLTALQGGEADGIAIVFSPERKLGLGGYGLGYTDLGGEGDFAIEIDTYRTQDHANDPPTPHISLHSPPHAHHRYSQACTPPDSIPYLIDGKINTLEVFYIAKERRVTAFLLADETSVDLGLFETTVPVGAGGHWYLGVTGACGGLWQKQEVLSLDVEVISVE